MFNTDVFQTEEDFSYTVKETGKGNTNRRYKFFRQRHFTAGDVEQFLTYWDKSNPRREAEAPLQATHPNVSLPLYHRIGPVDIFNTFKYMFDKFKKGIFFKVVNGKPRVFLPFSKFDYRNEWYRSIKINPRFKTIQEMMSYIAELEGRPFNDSRIHKVTKSWYGNNGLVRLEYPISENDSGVNMLRDMFVALVKERGIPSCELFINKRDFPILKKNGTEAYENFFGKNQKLRSHAYKRFAPVLSMTTADEYADIPIPTWEDWCRVSYYHDKRLFGKEYRTYPTQEEFDAVVWEDKKGTAVFRGASTGLGTTLDSNPRLYFSNLSYKKESDPDDGQPYLDAGITKWNLRPRVSCFGGWLDTIHIRELPFGLVGKLTPLEQAGYKYILHLPGHSMAYRLSLELMMGSVILMYPCDWKLWYSDMLKPYVHYVPLDPGVPDDVYIKIRWCKKNDERCKAIAANARAFAVKHLNREAILDYLVNVLKNLAKNTGAVHHAQYDMHEIMHEREQSLLEKKIWSHPNETYRECFSRLIESGRCGGMSRSLFQLLMGYYKRGSDSGDKVRILTIGGRKVIQKRLKGDVHEPTIGYMILNAIAEEIPNFIYTFHHDDLFVYLEHVEGQTFEELLLDPGTTLEQIIEIYRLVCLGIRHAQLVCGFMHMDLYPWNIIIKRFEKPVAVRYNISGNEYLEVMTRVMPVFIDYGRSHVVYEAQHFYNVSPFRICSIQDVVSVVFSSLHIYLKKNRLDEQQISTVFQVMKFFSQTRYMSQENLRNVSTLKMFLGEKKKFSNMLYDHKNGLDHFNPVDFYRHLHGTFKTCNKQQSRVGSFVMCPHLYNPVVCQIKFLEMFDLLDLDMEKDLYIKNVVINLRNEADMDEDVRAWCAVMLGCEATEAFYEKFSIRMPHLETVAKIPLFSSHPFVENQIQAIKPHYERKEWLVVFKMMIHDRIREDAFEVFTRCFRNFWFINLKK